MSICLATTWYPRGEFLRFSRLLHTLEEVYAGIVVSLIPSMDQAVLKRFTSGQLTAISKVTYYLNMDGRTGRYMALKKALETPADFIHYVDMDRLLHWVETCPKEWMEMVSEIEKSECIIFGRTNAAYLTHPQALISTEKISNQVVSYILKKEMDVSAGSKSFNRLAAQYIVDYCQPDNSIGTDAEWPIRLTQAGFTLDYLQVEGLDWESADQFQMQAANTEKQIEAARRYDADPKNWIQRIEIAEQIIKTAIEVTQKKIPLMIESKTNLLEFDPTIVFDVDDYMYFYSEELTEERTSMEVDTLVRLLSLDQSKKILDLACGYGRHTNRLAVMGHKMTGVDIMPGFLEIARQDASQKGVDVLYLENDMRKIAFKEEFDCVLLLFTAFGYFSDEDNLQVLINVVNALLPGGLLIFDTMHRDTCLKRLQPYIVVEKEGNMMIDRISFNSLQGRFYNKRIVFRDGIRKDKPFSIRLYNPNEIQALITQAGFNLEHIYGGWDRQELTPESTRMIVIARKPELV